MKLLTVINPVSGGVDKESFLDEIQSICDCYNIDHEVFKTTGEDDVQKLQTRIDESKPGRIAAVGGDGTCRLCAIALIDREIPLGLVPMGSANGMAQELGVPTDPIEAFKDILISQRIEGLDLLHINDKEYCYHLGDIGVNAKIIEAFEGDGQRGMLTYAKYFIEQLGQSKPIKAVIKTSESEHTVEGVMIGICNGRKFGTGIPLNVNGSPMDQEFEIVVIKEVSPENLINAGLSRFDENFHKNISLEVIKMSECEINFESPHLLQLDGELIGNFESIKVKVIPNAVQLITSARNPYL